MVTVAKWLDEHQAKCVQQQAMKKAEMESNSWWTQKRKSSLLHGKKAFPNTLIN